MWHEVADCGLSSERHIGLLPSGRREPRNSARAEERAATSVGLGVAEIAAMAGGLIDPTGTPGCDRLPQSWRYSGLRYGQCRRTSSEEYMTVMVKRPLVSVVDDNESVRESLPDLLRELGYSVRAFSSAEEFLASDCIGETKCLILDIVMRGMTGPGLQHELSIRGQEIPIIFITAQTDESVRARSLEQGAVECLFKPFSDTALLEALNAAFQVS
jgi:CheY-like chemotaxis protein